MDVEEATPIVEDKPFSSTASEAVKAASTKTKSEDRIVARSISSSSDSSATGEPDTSSPSSEGPAGGLAIPDTGGKARGGVQSETDMSESYHEIFDTQMPPEKAAASVVSEQGIDATGEGVEEVLEREARLIDLCGGSSSESATLYLTSKLVEDSLRWQQQQEDHPVHVGRLQQARRSRGNQVPVSPARHVHPPRPSGRE